jgi:hypothetical protein
MRLSPRMNHGTERIADRNFARRAERKGGVRHVGIGARLHQPARVRPLNVDLRQRAGDVGHKRVRARARFFRARFFRTRFFRARFFRARFFRARFFRLASDIVLDAATQQRLHVAVRRVGGDDHKAVVRELVDGHVRLDAAGCVQHLRVTADSAKATAESESVH